MTSSDRKLHEACPVCSNSSSLHLVTINSAPVFCNVLWSTRDAALNARVADIELVRCGDCGHIYNQSFDESLVEYSQGYENSLHFSELFSGFANELADRLIEQYDLRGKKVLEIGCGKGEFLATLCEKGANQGYGFDQSVEEGRIAGLAAGSVTFSNEFFSAKHASLKPDFVCCRHVLEHVDNPVAFLTGIRQGLGEQSGLPIYFEVPNGSLTLVGDALWDIIYEHPEYFSRQSLEYAFRAAGFEVERVYEQFSGQFLGLEARTTGEVSMPAPEVVTDLERAAREFPQRYAHDLGAWQERIAQLAESGARTVAWGAGSKGVSFLNALGRDIAATVEYIVDINVHKHGKYVAGTGQEVVPVEHLANHQPQVIIVMNPVYLDEIRQAAGQQGVQAEFLCA